MKEMRECGGRKGKEEEKKRRLTHNIGEKKIRYIENNERENYLSENNWKSEKIEGKIVGKEGENID